MKINLVLLFAQYTDKFSYYDDWIDAFKREEFNLQLLNIMDPSEYNQENLKKIDQTDLIILHHSVLADNLSYIEKYKSCLTIRKTKLFSFVGNEVNLPILGLKPKIDFLKSIQPDYIFTQLLQEAGDWLYSDCINSKVLSVPHALNTSAFKSTIPVSQRGISIGTRSSRYGSYLGDNDRNRIAEFFKNLAPQHHLNIDLSGNCAKLRFNREEWAQFLNQCKSTITTEAGSYYIDKDDKTLNEIVDYLRSKKSKCLIHSKNIPDKNSMIRKLYKYLLPSSLQTSINQFVSKNLILENCLEDENINFEEIWDKFFKNRPKAPVYTKCISSRHFDAIGTKTLQIAFPGRFNDILLPEHYVTLNPDFSNIEDVLSILSNDNKIQEITENAYTHITNNHTYVHRINTILQLL